MLDLGVVKASGHAMLSDLILAPLVVMQRLPVIWAESLMPHGSRPESDRMVREKVAAVAEGIVAAQVEMHRMLVQATLDAMVGKRPPSPAAATARLASAALRPSARRVKANAKRLRKG